MKSCWRAQSEGESAALEEQAQIIDWNMHNTIVAALGNKIIWRAYNTNAIKMRLIRQERFRIQRSIGANSPVRAWRLILFAARGLIFCSNINLNLRS